VTDGESGFNDDVRRELREIKNALTWLLLNQPGRLLNADLGYEEHRRQEDKMIARIFAKGHPYLADSW
jgi:hypothetical protein